MSGLVGMASAMRYRLETERQSPFPEEIHDDDERNDISASLGLGNGIAVAQDNEELPSRVLADGGDHGDSDDVDFFSESYGSNVEGTIVALPPEPSNTMKDQKQEGQSRNGTDSQCIAGTHLTTHATKSTRSIYR